MERGRILVLTRHFPVFSETFVFDHVLGLYQEGWNVHVACFSPNVAALARLHFPAHAVPVHAIDPSALEAPRWQRMLRVIGSPSTRLTIAACSRYLREAILLAPALRRILADVGPHLVHAHFGPMGLLAAVACRKQRVPLIVDFHGYDVTTATRAEGWEAYRHYLRDATAVAHSAFVENLLRRHTPIHVVRVPLGVDRARFSSPSRAQRWPAPLRLLTVGRLVFQKGHHVALETLALLRRGRDPVEATLTICGAGEDEARLRQHAEILGVGACVGFTGEMDPTGVATLMRESDVLLVPSLRTADGWEEAFCRVAVEGMASGLLVAGSDVGGLPDTIGSGGFTVPPGDAAALAGAIRRSIRTSTPAEHAGPALRRAVDFSSEEMRGAYDRVACQARLR